MTVPTITRTPFGRAPDGAEVSLYTLRNGAGLTVKLTNYGGIVTAIEAPARDGRSANVTLGFDALDAYAERSPYFGALVGRYANRIAHGRFLLDGNEYRLPLNDGHHHLHGGPHGFDKVVWEAAPFAAQGSAGLRLHYLSHNGEQGYPGNLDVRATYELGEDDTLRIGFEASTDRATPVNLTSHIYFNLAGGGTVLGHELEIFAERYTPVDAGLIPTGELAGVAGTPFDFRTPRRIGERIGADDAQLHLAGGYDHNFVLDGAAGTLRLAARVRDPQSGRTLDLYTDQPGLQFYSGNYLDGTDGFPRHGGLCLEPQHFPDSPNRPAFPDTILRPGASYSARLALHFGH